jgi:hypothetical protein
MKGLIAAALFAVATTVILSFAATSGFTFKQVNAPPVVVDRGLPAPDVQIEKDGRVVAYDEFGPDPTVPVEPSTRAQPIVEVVKKEAVAKPKPVAVKKPEKRVVTKVDKKTQPRDTSRPVREPRRRVASKPSVVEPPKQVVAKKPEPEPLTAEQEQIARDREWRRQTLERWAKEERERQKREREKTRRAVRNEFDNRGRLRPPTEGDYMEGEEVERILKRRRG